MFEAIADTIEQLYRCRPLRVVPINENPDTYRNMLVCLIQFPNHLGDRVIKVAGRSDWMETQILSEQRVLGSLRRAGVSEVPEVEFSQQDQNELGLPFFTMPRIVPADEIASSQVTLRDNARTLWRSAGRLRGSTGALQAASIEGTLTEQESRWMLLDRANRTEASLSSLANVDSCLFDLIDAARELFNERLEWFGQCDPSDIVHSGEDAISMIDFSGLSGAFPVHYDFAKTSGYYRCFIGSEHPIHETYRAGYAEALTSTPEETQRIDVLTAYTLIQELDWMIDIGALDRVHKLVKLASDIVSSRRPV